MGDYFNDLINESNLENALKWTWLEWDIKMEEFDLDEEYNPSDYLIWFSYKNPVNE